MQSDSNVMLSPYTKPYPIIAVSHNILLHTTNIFQVDIKNYTLHKAIYYIPSTFLASFLTSVSLSSDNSANLSTTSFIKSSCTSFPKKPSARIDLVLTCASVYSVLPSKS